MALVPAVLQLETGSQAWDAAARDLGDVRRSQDVAGCAQAEMKQRNMWLSKPFWDPSLVGRSFWLVGEFTSHLEPILVGIGMLTGGTGF